MVEKPTSLEDILNVPFLKDRLNEIQKEIALSPYESALWIGAGYSAGLRALPTWKKFLLDCLESIDKSQKEYFIIRSIIEAGRLQLAAEYLYQILGDILFVKIGEAFGGTGPLLKPVLVSKFCVANIITTNYDNILEDSMKYYRVKTPLDSIDSLMGSQFNLIKLHGNANKPESCVLTISSYIRTYNREFEWYLINTFLTNTVIFIGASMDKSEPFFKSISTIKKFNKGLRKHYAIVSVYSNEHAKELGKELEKMGIYLIPYIPDSNHSVLDEILNYLSEYNFKPEELKMRLDYLRMLIKQRRFIEITAFLHNMCQDEINNGWNIEFGDVINNFLTELLTSVDANEYVALLKNAKLNLSNIIRTASNLKNIKFSALEGFDLAFQRLAKFDGENYEIDIMNIRNRLKRLFKKSTDK